MVHVLFSGQCSKDMAQEVSVSDAKSDENYGGVDALAKAIQHSKGLCMSGGNPECINVYVEVNPECINVY